MTRKTTYRQFSGHGPTQIMAKNMAVVRAEMEDYELLGALGVFTIEELGSTWNYLATFTYVGPMTRASSQGRK